MKVIITKNYQEVSAKAARFVLAQLWHKPNFVIGLATGATPVGMYKKLIEAHKEGRADFSSVTTFNLDEYLGISPTDPESYRVFMKKNLFGSINLKNQNINLLDGMADNPNQECLMYEQSIKNAGGIDLQVLGLGSNAHIGFNEPGTSFDSITHVTKLTTNTRKANDQYFKDRHTPSNALTMGLSSIMQSKKVLLLVSGKAKAKAVADAIEGSVRTQVPASILQWHPDVTVILDEDAASKLKRDYSSPLLFTEGDVEVLTKQDLPEKKKIVIVSPHPDDASISMGGTISELTKKNKVHIVIATTGYRSVVSEAKISDVISIREKEAKKESKILGAVPYFLRAEFYDAKDVEKAINKDTKKLSAYFKKIKPDIIFVPQVNDKHPTHKLSREVALKSLLEYSKKSKSRVSVWGYEGLWSLFGEGDFNTIFAFDDKTMNQKMKAIASQESQLQRTRFDIAAKSLAQLRAAIVPEQALVGYGAKAPKLPKYIELFNVA
jgi:glucosamine-6-phosphate deaminase